MKEADIKRFIDRLDEDIGPFTGLAFDGTEFSEEERALGEIWRDLGALNGNPPSDKRLVADFGDRLEVYRQGWEGALVSAQGAKKPSLGRLVAYGLAACFAGAIFYAGIVNSRLSDDQADIRAELSETRETLALALLDQASSPKRLAGLDAATRIDNPSRALLDAVVWTLDNDANLNVRLAAVEALGALPNEAALALLIDRLGSETSPLMQMELLREAMDLAGEEKRDWLIERLDTLPIEPRVKRYIDRRDSRI